MEDHDDPNEDDWPNDEEANDVMLAYAATDGSYGSGSGCAGVILISIVTTIALIKALP
ncbi:MAG: hypothetical protein AB7J13_16100 [Pyrinomonadaceae bacterium]